MFDSEVMDEEIQITEEELDELKAELYKEVDDLVDRVSPVYKILGWEWHGCGVPSKSDIRQCAYRLIRTLSPGEHYSFVASGGLKAEYWGYKSKDGEDTYWEGTISMQVDEFAAIKREN